MVTLWGRGARGVTITVMISAVIAVVVMRPVTVVSLAHYISMDASFRFTPRGLIAAVMK